MPKPVTMTIDIEEALMGKVWRSLDTMPGVISINIHGASHKPKRANGAAPTKRGGPATVECIILGVLKDADKALDREALYPAIEAGGKNRNSVPDSITKLKNKKFISVPKPGLYRITPAGRKRYENACVVSQQEEK